jgi:uncharacterized YceG family protein
MALRPMTKKKSNTKSRGKSHAFWRNMAIFMVLMLGGVIGTSSYFLSTRNIDPWEFYVNMANPYERFVRIYPGLRKEQIADIYSKVLGWNDTDTQAFLNSTPTNNDTDSDGYYFPGSYWFGVNTGGAEVAKTMMDSFTTNVDKNVLDKKGSNLAGTINLDTAVRIASIIQREAAGKADMPLISGIIWNRLFQGMDLQIDATLQYAKGTSTDWWPQVLSDDKNIDSPFNTYKNKGLPPDAISEPSLDAIEAAYNPQKTSCIFYIHDNNHNIHCSTTYAPQVKNVQTYLVDNQN